MSVDSTGESTGCSRPRRRARAGRAAPRGSARSRPRSGRRARRSRRRRAGAPERVAAVHEHAERSFVDLGRDDGDLGAIFSFVGATGARRAALRRRASRRPAWRRSAARRRSAPPARPGRGGGAAACTATGACRVTTTVQARACRARRNDRRTRRTPSARSPRARRAAGRRPSGPADAGSSRAAGRGRAETTSTLAARKTRAFAPRSQEARRRGRPKARRRPPTTDPVSFSRTRFDRSAPSGPHHKGGFEGGIHSGAG